MDSRADFDSMKDKCWATNWASLEPIKANCLVRFGAPIQVVPTKPLKTQTVFTHTHSCSHHKLKEWSLGRVRSPKHHFCINSKASLDSRWGFPLHTLEIGPQISYYIFDIASKTIKTCKCKCNQDGNSFRNNLRVRVNLVHPTLGGA